MSIADDPAAPVGADALALWRRVRMPLLIAALFVAFAVVLAVVAHAPPQRPLDPSDASPVGARALAELLRGRGVDVTTTTAGGVTGATVFLPDPGALTRQRLEALSRDATTVVVIAPQPRELAALGVHDVPSGFVEGRVLQPGCAQDASTTAGPVTYTGVVYGGGNGERCYDAGTGAGLVVSTTAGARIVVYGSPTTFDNDQLDEQGNAALGIGLLDDNPRLVWVPPAPPAQAPADARHRSFWQLLSPGVHWFVLALLVTVALLALWRARRLGPVVVEPLPVVVRASETVEGRARLLRVARARDSAAAGLRAAAAERLRVRLHLEPSAGPAAITAATASGTGRAEGSVGALLYGPVPGSDDELVRLASELDELVEAVRSTEVSEVRT